MAKKYSLAKSTFARIAVRMLREHPRTSEKRVEWQDTIADLNRNGELTNEETLRLLAILNRIGRTKPISGTKRRRTYGKRPRR